MTSRNQSDHASAVVITSNFVEAEDITDALHRFGFDDVTHFRSVEHATTYFEDGVPMPAFALMSIQGSDDVADALCKRLRAAGCRQVLINGDPDRAVSMGASFLQRPYSNVELDRCIADVMRGAAPLDGAESA
ncbi:hypothetical protein [Tateyamaria sp. ANG-S1]|uniref:hypothetical protein n=1 Tax=Tateyamaria sp. ANG-S1 TaxID=1577905 RepID=UPI00057CA33B|nr:hypothetical protein [Tateyamaria sp. ANG-S1]